jgi:putative colanic acid biosynthesis acetyltransferase WcaF
MEHPPNEEGAGAPERPQAPKSTLPLRNLLARAVWNVAWVFLFRATPRFAHGWRRALLRLFGARIGRGCLLYPSARIWAPWNLEMGDYSILGPDTDCYCVARVSIGERAWISQYTYLCAAGHDIGSLDLPLTTAPIAIGPRAWVCARAYVNQGVTIGEGAVVGAGACVFHDVAPWTVVGGNPAKLIKQRVVKTPPAGP